MGSFLTNIKTNIGEAALKQFREQIRTQVHTAINNIVIPGVSDDIKSTIKGGFDEILDNSDGEYYDLDIIKQTVVIHTAKVKPIIINIIDSIKTEDTFLKTWLSEVREKLNELPDEDDTINKDKIQSMITQAKGGKRKTKKKYKNTKQRRMRVGGGVGVGGGFLDVLSNAFGSLKNTPSSPASSSPASSSSASSSPASSSSASSSPASYKFELTGNNITPGQIDEINEKICTMIKDSLNSKLDGFETKLGNISETVLTNARNNLMEKMELAFLEGFNEKLDEFKQHIVNNKKSDDLMQEIIYELGIKFDDALTDKQDSNYAEVYAKFVKFMEDNSELTEKNLQELSERGSDDVGSVYSDLSSRGNSYYSDSDNDTTDLNLYKSRLKALMPSPERKRETKERLAELLAKEKAKEKRRVGGGRKTMQNKTKRKKQNKTKRKKQNKTKRKK